MADSIANFAYSPGIATAPSPATSGTSLVTTAGHGARFTATPPFNCTIWPKNTAPTKDNAEIVRVTAISTDTFTITRAQEGTTAKTITTDFQISQSITKKYIDDINTALTAATYNWLGAWTTSTVYALRDTVQNNGSSYVCILAHTSGASTEPGVGASWTTNWSLQTSGITSTDRTNLNNLSGTNTGDQTVPVKATGAEVTTGTNDTKFATPLALADAKILNHQIAIPTIIVNGVGENTTSTSYNDMAYWKATFDKSLYTNIVSIKFQALLQQNNAGSYQIWCQLVTTAGVAVTGSELTATLGQYGTSVQTSGDIASALTSGADGYRVQAKTAASGLADIQYAAIIVNLKV